MIPDIGGLIGGLLSFAVDPVGSVINLVFTGLWQAALLLLSGAFFLVDQLTQFDISAQGGPVAKVWPLMLTLAGLVAVSLFFLQVTMMALRGGRGFVRVVTGPVQYGLAVTLGVGVVAGLVAAADGITTGLLLYLLNARHFVDVLQNNSVLATLGKGVSGVVLGIVAVFGVIPAALGFALEMLFRQAAILLLVATMPISAAGLLSDSTNTWFWRSSRWTLAAIFMKPVFALTVFLGVGILSAVAGGN